MNLRRIMPVSAALAVASGIIGVFGLSASLPAAAAASGAIINANGYCLDNQDGRTVNDNPVQIYTCTDGSAQQWNLPGNGTVTVQADQAFCLDVYRSSKKAGSQVVVDTCNGSASQQWTVNADKTIRHKHSKLCLDNRGGVAADGNRVQIAACTGNAAQQWTVPVETVPTPPPAPTPPPPTPGTSPSGEDVPIGDLPGWKQTFIEDFTIDAPTGSWATTESSKIVYTGAHGGQWKTYPDGWPSTYTNGKPGYQPGKVLSVHDGMLDFHLQDVNGLPSGAAPSPLVAGTTNYQTYGRYVARLKSDPGLYNYHAAWLLWPRDDANGGCAESDFPEGGLDSTVSAFAHNATKCSDYTVQDAFDTDTRFDSGWHTYVQEWMPGMRRYYIDGVLIGQSTTNVWSQEERWVLQTEPKSGSSNGHLYVDWVAAYAYQP